MKFVSSRGSRAGESSRENSQVNKRSEAPGFSVPPEIARHPEQSSWISKPAVQTQQPSQASKTYFTEYTRMTLTPEQQQALERVVQKAATQRTAEQVNVPQHLRPAKQQRTAKQAQIQSQRLRQAAAQSQQLRARRNKSTQAKKKNTARNAVLIIILTLVLAGAGFGGWYYWWTEYATFDYTLQPVVLLEGQRIDANAFLFDSEEMENVSAIYRNAGFRPTPGRQDVHLTLRRGWRSLDTVASLHVLSTIPNIDLEYAEELPDLQPIDLISNPSVASDVPYSLAFVEPPMPLNEYSVGVHTLQLTLNDAPFEVTLNVTDTTPPTATARSHPIRIGESVLPTDFVADVFDASGSDLVTIEYYADEPNVFSKTSQIIQIKLTDIYGNYSVVNADLMIEVHAEPPVIEGAGEIISIVGNPILYRQGLTATDSFGGDLTEEIVIEAENVDPNKVGIYKVRFWVEDLSGNKSDVTEVEVHIIDVNIDYIYSRVDETLARILRDGMTQLQQVQAIHTFVKNNISYANAGRPHTVYEGAYRALRDRRGNCYNYFSLSAVMLERAGIPNMMIERIPGTPTRHRWNLVNPDNLGWHHYDAVPNRLGQGLRLAFFTDTQAESFTRQMSQNFAFHNYYNYVRENYPEVVR